MPICSVLKDDIVGYSLESTTPVKQKQKISYSWSIFLENFSISDRCLLFYGSSLQGSLCQMEANYLSMIKANTSQCGSVHIHLCRCLELFRLSSIWVIFTCGPWLLSYKFLWQVSFSIYLEGLVKISTFLVLGY